MWLEYTKILECTVSYMTRSNTALTLPYTGLAAASTEHLAFRRAWMPALAIVTLPCSITSWMAVLSMSDILSNSSMHTTPLSANTMAPASSLNTARYHTLTLWSQKFICIISTCSVPIPLKTVSTMKTSQGKAVIGQ